MRSKILFYFDAGKEREQVGDGEVAKVSLQLLSRVSNVMYYQFECQNFLTQESLYPPPRKKGKRERFIIIFPKLLVRLFSVKSVNCSFEEFFMLMFSTDFVVDGA